MRKKRKLTAALALAASSAIALLLAALATGASQSPDQGVIGSGKQTKLRSVCGLGTGKAAKGPVIKIGAIATKQPGTDFTDIPNMAKAYFDCVNNNGGIFGRRIQYSIETEQTDPGQNAALAKKLAESTKVVGMVGNTSIIECAINHKYWEAKGFYVIALGYRTRVLRKDDELLVREHGAALQLGRSSAVRHP